MKLERAKLGKSLGGREEIYRREWEGGVGARGNSREGTWPLIPDSPTLSLFLSGRLKIKGISKGGSQAWTIKNLSQEHGQWHNYDTLKVEISLLPIIF